jgi:hypothetical protein
MSSPPTITEREKFDTEKAFREREIALREAEQKLKERELDEKGSRWTSPLVVAILAAAIAGGSNAIVAYMNDAAQRDAIKSKAEGDRLLEAIKGEDDKVRASKLEFLNKLGLVFDRELSTKIDLYIVNVLSQKAAPTETPPVVQTCDGKVIKSVVLPSVSAQDGAGNKVGIVGPGKLDISQRCDNGKPGPFQFLASYQFYNGSGTWCGSQDITVTLHAQDSSALAPPITFALDRGRCVYGGAQTRFADGVLPIDPKLIVSATLEVSRVKGTQTPC